MLHRQNQGSWVPLRTPRARGQARRLQRRDVNNRKSTRGVLFLYRRGPISWNYKAVFHDWYKHIQTSYHFTVDNGDIDIQFGRTADQHSDIMTKSVGRVQFQELRHHIGIVKVKEN
jgi:hypothetical protein